MHSRKSRQGSCQNHEHGDFIPLRKRLWIGREAKCLRSSCNGWRTFSRSARNKRNCAGAWCVSGRGRIRVHSGASARRAAGFHRACHFFGHTHHQGGFAYMDSNLEVLQIRPAPRKLLLPCALSRTSATCSILVRLASRETPIRAPPCYCRLQNQTVEFWRVPYDIGKVQSRMRKAGLPEPLVQRLEFAR